MTQPKPAYYYVGMVLSRGIVPIYPEHIVEPANSSGQVLLRLLADGSAVGGVTVLKIAKLGTDLFAGEADAATKARGLYLARLGVLEREIEKLKLAAEANLGIKL